MVSTADVAAARRVRDVLLAAPRAFLGRGIEVDLDVGVREHDGADVAAFHHDAGA